MEYSFYGGRPGKSFIIAKDFPTYKDMETAFAKGWEYQDVGYDEYVLINTTDPRNVENGKLYKRGLEGPIYVGTIQGTPGYSPHLQIDKYSDIQESDADGLDYLYSYSDNNQGNIELVPGKDGNQFNDSIEWKMLSVRTMYYRDAEGKVIANTFDYDITENTVDRTITFMDGNVERTESYYEGTSAEETIVKIGFKFPYHVFDWQAHSIDPYNKDYRTELQNQNYNYVFDATYSPWYNNLSTQTNNGHPFYSNIKIRVPHGIKGDSIGDLKVITAEDYYYLKYPLSSYYEGDINGAKHHPEWQEDMDAYYTENSNDRTKPHYNAKNEHVPRKILVYEYMDYKYHPEGTKITKYLADFDMVEDIVVNPENGDFTTYYTHRDAVTQKGAIGWINHLEIRPEDFHLLGYFNNGQSTIDLGSVKVDSTLSVAFNIKPTESFVTSYGTTVVAGNTISENLNFLNTKYQYGLTQAADGKYVDAEWMRGKIITIGPEVLTSAEEEIQKKFFAYDYNKNEWYYLGNFNHIEVSRAHQLAAKSSFEENGLEMQTLDNGGICFLYTPRPAPVQIVSEENEE